MNALLAKLRFARDHRWAPDRMSAFLDHDLPPRQRMRVERHVSECRQCRRVLTGLQLLVASLNRVPAPADGDATRIAASVRVRIREPA